MSTITWAIHGRKYTYSPISETAIPAAARFSTPDQFAGQIVVYSFGHVGAGDADVGDQWMRVVDRSTADGPTYYARLRS